MQNFIDTVVGWFYYADANGNPDLLKSMLAFFGFVFMIFFVLEAFYAIRSGLHSAR